MGSVKPNVDQRFRCGSKANRHVAISEYLASKNFLDKRKTAGIVINEIPTLRSLIVFE